MNTLYEASRQKKYIYISKVKIWNYSQNIFFSSKLRETLRHTFQVMIFWGKLKVFGDMIIIKGK